MAAAEVIVLPLNEAVFCASCEQLTNTKGTMCLVCGSAALFNLAAVLDREPVTAEELYASA